MIRLKKINVHANIRRGFSEMTSYYTVWKDGRATWIVLDERFSLYLKKIRTNVGLRQALTFRMSLIWFRAHRRWYISSSDENQFAVVIISTTQMKMLNKAFPSIWIHIDADVFIIN